MVGAEKLKFVVRVLATQLRIVALPKNCLQAGLIRRLLFSLGDLIRACKRRHHHEVEVKRSREEHPVAF